MLKAVLVLAAIGFAWTQSQAQTLDRIAETKTVRIGFVAGQAPFAFKSADGKPTGYAIDVCGIVVRAIGERIAGVSPQYVETTMTEGFDAVAADRIDLLCGAITATLGRRTTVDFSEPIFLTGMSALMRAHPQRTLRELFLGRPEINPTRSLEMAPFSIARIGVRTGTTTEATLRSTTLREGYNVAIVGYETHAGGLAALEAGAIDAYLADRGLLTGLMAGTRNPGQFTLGSRLFSREPYAIAMRRGDDDLRLLVDRALTAFYDTAQFTGLLSRYFGEDASALKVQIIAMSMPE